MRSPKLSIGSTLTFATLAVAVLLAGTNAAAQQVKILHSFQFNGRGGFEPNAGVIFDAAGDLYGTTVDGGTGDDCAPQTGCGTVFELTPTASGGWAKETLHDFNGETKDGYFPTGGLTSDAAGNLYGTTVAGGRWGRGTVFELTPKAGGGWSEKILHSFGFHYRDGRGPQGGVVFDAAGNLYGTTVTGGKWLGRNGGGTVFELTPRADGSWADKILHNFGGGVDGFMPYGGVVLDAAGNLYGTTTWGGTGSNCYECGIVFELVPKADGTWSEKILHNFNGNGTDGYQPEDGLILDAAGNLYGTTTYGGGNSCHEGYTCGTVFELTPQEDGSWAEKIVHDFDGNGTDGYTPGTGRLTLDAAGNLYGTTIFGTKDGPASFGYGTVFELSPEADGTWSEKILHAFTNLAATYPEGTLILDPTGNFYGTVIGIAATRGGAVFEITP
jgi:uncharacterized repeat protein (TIGR03803 family)